MAEQTFIVAVDVADDRIDHDGLRSLIRGNPDFTAWWNHIPAVYLIQTRLTVDELSAQVEQHTNKARYFVMKVDPRSSQGWLPDSSWTWLERRVAATDHPQDASRSK